jgi:hypothetical protein
MGREQQSFVIGQRTGRISGYASKKTTNEGSGVGANSFNPTTGRERRF